MPVRGSKSKAKENDERRKEEFLARIKEAAKNTNATVPVEEINELSSDEDSDEELRTTSLNSYRRFIDQTMDLPLEKLIMTPEGVSVFDELCLRLDINQKYADLLPQWTDVAHKLEVDQLMTKWVEVCVRPREGLTRAMLEIYMKDGGTLGEVLSALLHLECLDILELTKPKIEKYIKLRDSNELMPQGTFLNNDNFFSVLKTLILALGNKDPCQDLHKYSGGLKNGFSPPMEHTITVQSAETEVLNNNPCLSKDWPHYQSELHLHKKSKLMDEEFYEDLDKSKRKKISCKVLLLFSEDGVPASEMAIEVSKSLDLESDDCQLEVFRLNEATLWYEVLTNPEACCMKWTSEADYIMPILTPKFLHEIHGKVDSNSDTGLLPTSPVLNKFMYNLARSQYTQNGCKNYKVRPLIPPSLLSIVRNSNAIKMDPLFASTWKVLKEDQLKSRLKAMMGECVKKKILA